MRLIYRVFLLVLAAIASIYGFWSRTEIIEPPRKPDIRYKRRSQRKSELLNEINEVLVKLITHDSSNANDLNRSSQLLLEAGANNVIDGEVFDMLKQIVSKNVQMQPVQMKSTTKPKTTSRPNVQQVNPHQIKPIKPESEKQKPAEIKPHPDALYEFVKPVINLVFEEIEVPDPRFVDIIDKLNVKRKFLFDKRLKNEQKRINTEHTLKTADAKRQRQLDVINAGLPNGLESAPGKPPLKGAQFVNGGWLMPRIRKIDPNLKNDDSKSAPTQNSISPEELKETRAKILEQNKKVANGQFSKTAHTTSFEFIIVVQVHSRHDFLDFLLLTLEKQPNLENSLLVISTDTWDVNVNQVISKIDFMNYAHIVFPNSAQFYVDEYPAATPNDCFPLKKEEAKEKKCFNYQWSDTFGNYRESKVSNIKHHWWWKLNFVNQFFNFEKLVLLEEDHALALDAFDTIGHMEQFKCDNRDCDLFSLGNYQNNLKLSSNVKKFPPNQVHLTDWVSTQHNMGMVVPSKWVQTVLSMSDDFCIYDDYNWDWTLMHLSAEIIKPATTRPWKVALPAMARSQHMGITGCGTHFQKGGCNFESIRTSFENDQRALLDNDLLYPKQMTAAALKPRPLNVIHNGGWGDLRDIFMCQAVAINALEIDMSFLDYLK